MNSFSILRTNTALTTNIKLMVGSDYSLNMDSIDSITELSNIKFKKVGFNKDNYWDELIPYFWKDTPSDVAFSVKYDNDNDIMSNDFSDQYDELYNFGARNITNNKNYSEEYEYFAPLYIDNNKLPSNFIIFRVDGPGLNTINKDNIKKELFNKFKVVKSYDLTSKSKLGEWIERNFIKNTYYSNNPLYINFQDLEFSKWNGIDLKAGGYISKSKFLGSYLENEKEIFEFEKFITEAWKKNDVVFSNIVNFSFLFDDTPSTPELVRKWSLNRYYGFYIDDMIEETSISAYLPDKLKSNVSLSTTEKNILTHTSGDPFYNGFKDGKTHLVEYLGTFYKVEKIITDNISTLSKIDNVEFSSDDFTASKEIKYKIISDLHITDASLLNTRIGNIKNNILKDYNNNDYVINNFDDYDTWIIEINGQYHSLIKDGNSIKINSDYEFKFYPYYYTIKNAGVLTKYDLTPTSFKIYKLSYTDVKDFDTNIINTEYSKFEYEQKTEITNSDESKMYVVDYESENNPKSLDDYIYKNDVKHIPTTSEYVSNYETFKIKNNDLSDIWRKNPIYNRWCFKNSLSSNDYPYLLNNSLLFEDFNRTSDIFNPNPNRFDRNLDYFYTVNSSTFSYINHSLHIEDVNDNGINTNFNFEIDKYLTQSSDYFNTIFSKKTSFDKNTYFKNSYKYSTFNDGDSATPNITLFKGIMFQIYDVVDIKKDNNNKITNLNLKNSNTFNNYKFSILLTDSDNGMQWDIIDSWKMDKKYMIGDIVSYDDILYKCITEHTSTDPLKKPLNDGNWIYINNTILWSPENIYNLSDIIYNNGNYYICESLTGVDFWKPNTEFLSQYYNLDDIVLYKKNYYKSIVANNTKSPEFTSNWEITTKPLISKWSEVQIWNPSLKYQPNSFVYHNNTIYKSIDNTESGETPNVYTNKWSRYYSLEPDTDYVYNTSTITDPNNPLIFMNNKYYLIKSNTYNNTLENGINIYINKKWKNILINIVINDNTISNLRNCDRDLLYNDISKKLTAYNFISSINDLNNKYGFTDAVNYIIYDENGVTSNYNSNNIQSLPYIIKCAQPSELNIKVNSLIRNPISLNNLLKPIKFLNNGKINDISELNYYNNIAIGIETFENKNEPLVVDIYSGNKNIKNNKIYRYDGYYMPLFYDIELFDKTSSDNRKFDTSLTNFGIQKERIIQKVNLSQNVLKLKNDKGHKSLYPMLDEFGYTIKDFFIFKSSFDKNYYTQIFNLNDNIITDSNKIEDDILGDDIGIDPNLFKN